MEELDVTQLAEERPEISEEAHLKAILEGIIYITDEPLSAQQIAAALGQPIDKVKAALDALVADYAAADRGLSVRELAGGYKMATKPEHHEAIRAFVKKLTPPLKLSLPALETLAETPPVLAIFQHSIRTELPESQGPLQRTRVVRQGDNALSFYSVDR